MDLVRKKVEPTASLNTPRNFFTPHPGVSQSPNRQATNEATANPGNISQQTSGHDQFIFSGSPSNLTFAGGGVAFTKAVATSQQRTSDQSSGRTRPTFEVLERCRRRYVQVSLREEIEYGFVSPSEVLLSEFHDSFGAQIADIIQHIYLKEQGRANVLIALLKWLSTRRYEEVYPYAQLVAVAALSNKVIEVREAGIRAYENWSHREGIDVLKALHVTPAWLDEYRRETIAYLEASA